MSLLFFSIRSVGVRIGDDLLLQVAVYRRRSNNGIIERSMDQDSQERSTIGIKYEPIDLDNYCGTNVFQKFEMFITSLIFEEKDQ